MRVSDPPENKKYKILGNDINFTNLYNHYVIVWIVFC